MLSAVLGLFSQDLAVDLGTTTTRLYQRGVGVVCEEPTVVAVHTDRRGRRRVVAIGDEASPMRGRAPADLDIVEPVRMGQIHDYEITEALLHHFVRRVHGRNGWVSPKMVVAIPFKATDMERRALRESCESAGAREVHLVPRPLAAAIGADLPLEKPSGHLLVELGGGGTEISVVSMGGVVSHRVVAGGGAGMDRALVDHLRDRHGLLVGEPTAERLKIELGEALAPRGARTRKVAGRCLRKGVPRAVEVTAAEVYEVLSVEVGAIAHAIRAALDECPPELATDIVDHGVVLTGAASQLRGLEAALRDATGLAVVQADKPGRAVAHGTGRILEQMQLLEAVAC